MHKKGNEKELTYFFIMKYDQPHCLKYVSLRAFLWLFSPLRGVALEFCKRLS